MEEDLKTNNNFNQTKPFFPGQERGEKVIFFTRRHPLSFLGPFLFAFAMIIIPFLFYLAATAFGVLRIEDPTNQKIVIILSGCYLLFVLGFFLAAWIDYYLDVMIITDFRIVDVTQHVLFSRSVAEANLTDIEDVNADVKGVLPTVFHYGTVFVQTAGTARNFEFNALPNPYKISKMIVDMHQKSLLEEEKRETAEIGKSFAERSKNGENIRQDDIKKAAHHLSQYRGRQANQVFRQKDKNEYKESTGWEEKDNHPTDEKTPGAPPKEPEQKPEEKKSGEESIDHDELKKGGETDF